jgi:hypothetical protein
MTLTTPSGKPSHTLNKKLGSGKLHNPMIQKATQSNDSEIPTYLWEEHLLQDGPTPWDATTTDIPKLRLGMAMMR